MIEKISLEQFRQIKEQLFKLANEYADNDLAHKNDNDYDASAEEKRFLNQYFEIQSRLTQYDLSDIPFEEWRDMIILSDGNHVADFSKTRANIDFALVDYYGNGNFRGCNVTNLENLKSILNPNDFDELTIIANSSLFLLNPYSDEFKDKYYTRSLTIADLATLSTQQLEEIKEKDLKSHMNYQEYNALLMETIGVDKIVHLYQHSKEEYDAINKITNMMDGDYFFYSPNLSTVDLPTFSQLGAATPDAYLFPFDNMETNFPEFDNMGTHLPSFDNMETQLPSFDNMETQLPSFEEFLQQLKSADIYELKNICFEYARKKITNSRKEGFIFQEDYPDLFIKENPDIFLVNVNIPDEVKQRYFYRNLNLQDLLDYPDVFLNIPIDYFMESSIFIVQFIRDNYGMGKFQELVKKHSDVFEHLLQPGELYNFTNFLKEGKNLESAFTSAVKEYFLNYGMPEQFSVVSEGQTIYNVPDWLSSMKFKFVDKINTPEELLQYNDSVFVLDKNQRLVLDTFNIDNIKKFEQETGFFTHKEYVWSKDLEMFSAFSSYFRTHNPNLLEKQGIDFKNGNLSYEEFLTQLANCLDHMRKNNVFTDFPSYDWIQGEFRESYPEIFIDLNAPDDLKEAFYKNRLNPEFLYQHKDYIKYLVNKNLANTIKADMKLTVPGLIDDKGRMMPSSSNFIDEYVLRYGNEKFLQLCAKYGVILSNITISSLHGEIDNEQAIEQSLRNSIYSKIVKGKMDYSYLASVPELMTEHPEIFVNFDNLTNISQEERQRLTKAFYSRTLSFDDIKKCPDLMNILGDKNLFIAFGNRDGNHLQGRILLDTGYGRTTDKKYSDLELLQVFGNEKFLQLCAKYGRYMDGIANQLNKDITIRNGKYFDFSQQDMDFENGLSFEEISKRIENIIIRECKLGNIAYNSDDAPDFLKEKNPELFLEDNAPEELKKYFYNYGNNHPMSFKVLQKHKDWLPYLKNKSIATSLLRTNYSEIKPELIKYLELFGEENGIKLGINRSETVEEMIRSRQVDLMKNWYDKTGGKFIPDFVVMQNFNLEEADKFLASGSNWSNLMKIKSFARTKEARDAMLKLAYSFGAFDQDQRGFKKLQDLLTSFPKKIDEDKGYIIKQIDDQIDIHSQRGYFYHNGSIRRSNEDLEIVSPDMTPKEKEEAYNKMIEYAKEHNFIDLIDTPTLVNLLETLKNEKVNIDFSKPIFAQLYKKNEDGTYSLTINSQSYPKSTQIIRNILENFRELPILTPVKAHQLFGGFKLKYDADFREFLLANMDKIMKNPEYVSHVASIQKQFTDIKTINSNRSLTWELAVSYVQTNKFTSVNVGNEQVAEISAIAEYSQADFDTLQQIYNYGKQRTFSSIPRIKQNIEKTSGRYTYEILRLDDPLAMAIGTLTDCCQELNNSAEVCMEHSMVDKNGRVFLIRDDQGNMIAQSWVWRNKDVLCFDNIEIPEKTFVRTVREHPELGRKGFTDEVFEMYKQAAHDLLEEDEKVYKGLLESGKITQEQYDGLRLGKITVGSGYNDIAASLRQKSVVDKGTVSRPLPFEEPVKLSRGLYTDDSTTQYILEERDNRKEYDGETLPVHNDTYIEYTDDNFTEKLLLSLEKLEIVTKEDPKKLEIFVSDYQDTEHIVTEIAENYDLNPKTTRIVMNPNFAIIYDVTDDKLKIGDLFFNTKVDNGEQQMDIESKVIMQMRLALDQIACDKELDVSNLNQKQKEMYAKITGLTNEMDIERGVGHAK